MRRSRHLAAVGFFFVALVGGFVAFQADQPPVFANSGSLDTANAPIGVGNWNFWTAEFPKVNFYQITARTSVQTRKMVLMR